jgi:hypothetical protein
VIEVVEWDVANASPENKHARAFAILSRTFPDQPARDRALAIEIALMET